MFEKQRINNRVTASRIKYFLNSIGLFYRQPSLDPSSPDRIRRLEAFQKLGMGMFIHFNSATFQYADQKMDWPYGVIDNRDPRYRFFSPSEFRISQIDFKQWAAVAKSAGCKFAVLTAKHHEGFALWPTAASPHSIANSPYLGDIVREYVDTMRGAGIIPGLYFSIMDFHHNITEKGVSSQQKAFIKEQLRELLTGYGPVPYLVIDGWGSTWGGPRFSQLDYGEIADFVHSIQPDTLILNHSCECSYEHTDVIMFENTAGQCIPKGFQGYGVAGNILTSAWFWKYSDPNAKLRSAEWAVREKLIPMNRQGVVFMLNVSPNQQGRIDSNVAEVFRQIGELRGV